MPETGLSTQSTQTALRRIVTWENGAPVVKDVPMLTPTVLNEIGAAAIAQPYNEPGDELALEMGLPPSEFYGLTLMEVMLIRQARNAARSGDVNAIEAIRDRIQGKPKATVESHSITETYEQYLVRVSKNVNTAAGKPAAPIEAEVVRGPSWENDL